MKTLTHPQAGLCALYQLCRALHLRLLHTWQLHTAAYFAHFFKFIKGAKSPCDTPNLPASYGKCSFPRKSSC